MVSIDFGAAIVITIAAPIVLATLLAAGSAVYDILRGE